MREITILHLSDIHFKKKNEDEDCAFRRHVQQKMIEAVTTHIKNNPVPDIVAITGDIVFSGKEKEYKEALVLFRAFKSLLPKETIFLVVPGNHDINRYGVDEFFSLQKHIVKERKADQFLQRKKKIKDFINVKFKSFRKFSKILNPELYESKDDYFWVKNINDKRVSFLGLNSCWASESDNDKNNIALGFPQVKTALEKSKFSNRILLMHHPPTNWLIDLEYGRCKDELFKNCSLLLHGHNHFDQAEVFRDPDKSIICLGANASYTNNKDGYIGFQFIRAIFNENSCRVRVWPYIFDKRRNEFVSDRERWVTQNGMPYFDIQTLDSMLTPVPESLRIPEEYKTWVSEFHSSMFFEKLGKGDKVIFVGLPEIYISLDTTNPFHKSQKELMRKNESKNLHIENINGNEKEYKPKEQKIIDIEILMSRVNCILLRGNAGMGKTTLIKHLAYTIIVGSCHEFFRGYLPIVIFLKDLWPIYEEKNHSTRTKIVFEHLLENYLEKNRCPLTMRIISNYLSQGRALFLVDGLDEVPDVLRTDIVDIIHNFQFENKMNRFLITGRPHGIAGKAMERFGKYLQDIEYLDSKKINNFISLWFRTVSIQSPGLTSLTAEDLISDIRLHEHITVFTQIPLLLTAVCLLYLVGGKRLPEQRADLYDRIIENLLYKRFFDPEEAENVNKVGEYLMLMAYTMHNNNIKNIEVHEAVGLLKKEFPPKKNETKSVYKERIKRLFNKIEPHCGLLNRMSSGELEFAHLTFQEFLTAKYMIDMDIDYKKFLEKSCWEETLLLYFGLMNLKMKKRSNEFVKEIILKKRKDKKNLHRLWLLGSKALRDFQPSRRDNDIEVLAQKKLNTIINSNNINLEMRFEAGDILGCFGDLRIKSENMVLVDGGDFIRGTNKVWDNEKPQRSLYLDSFMIGKYVVTNEEFKKFIEEGGYQMEKFWTQEGWKWRKDENISEPRYWHDRKWNGPNFPVIGVSWYEAFAYAMWLSHETRESHRLPTEAEWEKAARGTTAFEYPWGNEFVKNFCNSRESRLNRTSPIGIFPRGKSPYGCYDMSGNVWEWCFDWFNEDYYKNCTAKNPPGPTDGSYKVFRGGSWSFDAVFCRSAYRFYTIPSYRDFDLGFRIAKSL